MPTGNLADERVGIVPLRGKQGRQRVGSAVYGRAQSFHSRLPDVPGGIFPQEPDGDRDDLILRGPAGAFLAAVASERMECPCSYLCVAVVEVRDQFRQSRHVQEMVEHVATLHPYSSVGVAETPPDGRRRVHSGRQQVAERLLRSMRDAQVSNQRVVVHD